jgi:ankyrin repeat protein
MIDVPEAEAAIAEIIETASDAGELNRGIISAAYLNLDTVVVSALKKGADANYVDPETGFCALHIAIGANNFPLARILVEDANASFFPDRFGRWPSLIAAECEVDEQLTDYVAEQEARFLKQDRSA